MRISKKNIFILGLSLSAFTFTVRTYAEDFTNADALFQKRDTGASSEEKFENATRARQAYAEIYKNASGDDKLYAFTQMGRLDIFRGIMIPDPDGKLLSNRKQALEACIHMSEKEARNSNLQEHHYFYVACLGGLGKISGFLDRAALAMKLKKEESTALATTKVGDRYVGGFEGGGILRIFAGVYVNKKAKAVRLYNPKLGLEFANIALDTPAKANKPFESMSGKDYFDNFYYQAEGMMALGMETKNRSLITDAKDRLNATIDSISELKDASALPAGREPEILHYQELMVELRDTITKCLSENDWNKCLENNLEE